MTGYDDGYADDHNHDECRVYNDALALASIQATLLSGLLAGSDVLTIQGLARMGYVGTSREVATTIWLGAIKHVREIAKDLES